MLRLMSGFTLVSFLVLLVGCAGTPQQPVSLTPGSVPEASRIGVLLDVVPQPDTAFPGASCLLCMAAASAMNSSLTSQVKTFSVDDLKNLDEELVKSLSEAGYQVEVIENTSDLAKLPKLKSQKIPNFSPVDFSKIQEGHQIDYMLVVEFYSVGVHRNFSSYIPTGAPQAVVLGRTYLVDLSENVYQWYQPLSIYRSAEGEWDEPPAFPGVTNAFYQAIEVARDKVIKSFVPQVTNTAAFAQ